MIEFPGLGTITALFLENDPEVYEDLSENLKINFERIGEGGWGPGKPNPLFGK